MLFEYIINSILGENTNNYNNSLGNDSFFCNHCSQKNQTKLIGCKRCKSHFQNNCNNKKIWQPAFCPLICPKNFKNYSSDFWENGF